MIAENDRKEFWEFMYGIEDLPIPENGNKHFSLASNIIGGLVVLLNRVELDNIPIQNSKSKKSASITVNKNNDTLEKHIRTGQLTIRTLNSILCYFFFCLTQNFDNSRENIGRLKELVKFFDLLDFRGVDKRHIIYIDALINHFLKKARLPHVTATISSSWQLEFSYVNEQGEVNFLFQDKKDSPKSIDNPRANDDIDYIQEYKKLIAKEYGELKFVNFSMPIDQIIELPLLRIDEEIKGQLTLLRAELENIKNIEENLKEESLKREIAIKQAILDKKNSVFDLIELKQDIFIQAKAGAGKTTMLKWIAYCYSNDDFKNQHNFIPIFIELQSYKSDLIDLIEEALKDFKINFTSIENKNLLLLVDGLDEYSGHKQSVLIDELRSLKRRYNVQMVFSGRMKPKELDKKDFVIYDLARFTESDIARIFESVFQKEGKEYFHKLKSAGLLRQVKRPLYLLFLIIYLNRQGLFELKAITSLLLNKGRLMKTVILDEFLSEYENKDSNYDREHWRDLKQRQIELISYYGFMLTYLKNDVESIEKYLAEQTLVEYVKLQPRYNDIHIANLFLDFEKHCILSFKRGHIGFDKKELRLFFTALYLKESITSIKEYHQYQNKLKDHSESWRSIKQYLFGIMKPSILMEDIDTYKVGQHLVFNSRLLYQFKFAYEFHKNENLDTSFKLHSFSYFLSFVPIILINDALYEKSNARMISDRSIFFLLQLFIIRKLKRKKLSLNVIGELNYRYFHYTYGNMPFDGLYGMAALFRDSKDIITYLNPPIEYGELIFIEDIIEQEFVLYDKAGSNWSFLFSLMHDMIFSKKYVLENSPLYRVARNSEGTEALIFQRKNIRIYMVSIIKMFSTEFINFYLSHFKPEKFNLKTLYRFYIDNKLRILTSKLVPKAKQELLTHLNYIANNYSDPNGMAITFSKFIECCTDKQILRELVNEWKAIITDSQTPENRRLNLVQFFFRIVKNEDIPFFIGLLKDDNKEIQSLAISGLIRYNSPIQGDREYKGDEILEALHLLFIDPKTTNKLRHRILSDFEHYRLTPYKAFINDILVFADNGEVHYISAILFFGVLNITESIPYLLREMKSQKDTILANWCYYALFRMEYENYYRYHYQVEKAKWIYLSKLESMIENKVYPDTVDEPFFENCYFLGDEEFYERMKVISELVSRGDIDIPNIASLNRRLEDFDWKIRRLKECESYIKKDLPPEGQEINDLN